MVQAFIYPGLAQVAYETIGDLSSAVGLTAANIPPTKSQTRMALIQAVGGNVRYTLDGSTAPVAATTGHRLSQDSFIEVWDESLKKFSGIDDGGTAKLEVTYFGRGS